MYFMYAPCNLRISQSVWLGGQSSLTTKQTLSVCVRVRNYKRPSCIYIPFTATLPDQSLQYCVQLVLREEADLRARRPSSFCTRALTLKSMLLSAPKSTTRPPSKSGCTLFVTLTDLNSFTTLEESRDFLILSIVALSSVSAAAMSMNELC